MKPCRLTALAIEYWGAFVGANEVTKTCEKVRYGHLDNVLLMSYVFDCR